MVVHPDMQSSIQTQDTTGGTVRESQSVAIMVSSTCRKVDRRHGTHTGARNGPSLQHD
jgi:hypothetical protein